MEAEVSVLTYATLERGFSRQGQLANPTLDTILRVMHALNIDVKSLILAPDYATNGESMQEH